MYTNRRKAASSAAKLGQRRSIALWQSTIWQCTVRDRRRRDSGRPGYAHRLPAAAGPLGRLRLKPPL